MSFAGTNFKPAAGQWRVDLAQRKAQKATADQRVARALKMDARRVEHRIRQDVYARDGGCCRACGEALTFSGALTDIMHAHHLIFRSAGGSDGPENRIALDWECHSAIHEHRLRVEGDPNGIVTFTRVNLETGEVIESWDSECPYPSEVA